MARNEEHPRVHKRRSQGRHGWALLVVVLASLALSCESRSPGSSPAKDVLAEVLSSRRLRVAYIHYPPTAYRDATSGEMRGLFVDLIEEIARRLGADIEVEYHETTWADFASMLTSGRVDLSIAGTFSTIPRARVVAFTRPLVYLGRSAVVRRGDSRFDRSSGVAQFDDPSLRVGVVNGEGSHEYVVANFKNQEGVTVFSGSDLSQCLVAVSSGQVDVGLSDSLETQKYAKRHSEVVDLYADNPYHVTPIAWAVRRDDHAWRVFLNTSITTLESQGVLSAMKKAYGFQWSRPASDL